MFVQIVHFKLKTDTSRDEFFELTEQLIIWLRGKTRFVAYELYEGSENWMDRIAWENESFAHDGMKDFETISLAKRLTSLVNEGYSSFWGESITSAKL